MQRSGRGRHGREWFSPPGAGIYLSVVLRPDAWGDRLPLVTLAIGVAVARGLEAATGLPLELKWPNDVVIGRPWRKVAGILCESVTTDGRIDAVVAGIGINAGASAYPPEIANRATALEIELGRDVDAQACIIEVLAALADVTDRLHGGGHDSVLDDWRRFAKAGLSGAVVRWPGEHGDLRGIARDVDHEGALLVDDPHGARVRLIAGEVRWERLGGD
jgi:BirA family biotin operon repressor/biotin-[acetyl-CoA-carboxylase] ligase